MDLVPLACGDDFIGLLYELRLFEDATSLKQVIDFKIV